MPASAARPLPLAARRSLLVYNLLFPVAFAVLLPSLLSRTLRRGNYRAHFGQRLGRFSSDVAARLRSRRWHWIHSISVGETVLALKLARELHKRAPELCIALSVTTSTGFALAQEAASAAPNWLVAIYNPVDLRSVVRRTFDLLQPERVILIEGEAWPNLLAEAHARGIPVMLASARLSPRSARRFERFRAWTSPIFDLLEWIAVPEATDREHWRRMGLPTSKLRQTGNVKFDQSSANLSRTEEFRALLRPLGVVEQTPILVAGSTFPGEERVLVEMLPSLQAAIPGLILLVAPRHIERTSAILKELAALNIYPGLRSQLAPQKQTHPLPTGAAPHLSTLDSRPSTPPQQPSTLDSRPSTPPRPSTVLLDSTGELREWYALATVVFVGKSLTAAGGQNPAEAAALGKPVIVGPNMQNFQSLMDLLLPQDAILQVSGTEELQSTILALFQSPERRSTLGQNAQNALQIHAGATERTVDFILQTPVAGNC